MPDTTEEFDPKGYGFYYLTGHVAEKGFQAGSVVGTAALVPYAAFRHFRPRPNRDPAVSAVVQRALKLLSKSAGWGIVAAGLLETGMIYAKNIDQAGFEDRAYKLHYNESQNRTDTFARSGGLLGAMVGCSLGTSITNAVGGAAFGTAIGVLAHVSTYKDAAAGPNRMFAEVTQPSDSK